MSDLIFWTALAGGELTLVLLLLLTVSWFNHRRQRKQDRIGVQKFLDAVERARIEREAEIRGFVQDNFGLSDDDLERKAVPIIRGERRLYQSFVNLYLKRDADHVPEFHLTMESAVQPYWQLEGFPSEATPVVPAPVVPEAVASPVDDDELTQLKVENGRLSEELQITMNTMTRMLNEYSSMFSAGGAEALTTITAAATATDDTEAEDVLEVPSVANPADGVDLEVVATDDDEIAELEDLPVAPATDDVGHVLEGELDGRVSDTDAVDAGAGTADDDPDAGTDADVLVEPPDVSAATVSDDTVDDLLADVLGDTDLGLDDLFDEVAPREPDTEHGSSGSEHDDAADVQKN